MLPHHADNTLRTPPFPRFTPLEDVPCFADAVLGPSGPIWLGVVHITQLHATFWGQERGGVGAHPDDAHTVCGCHSSGTRQDWVEQNGEKMVSEAIGAHLEFVTLSGFAPLRLLCGRKISFEVSRRLLEF